MNKVRYSKSMQILFNELLRQEMKVDAVHKLFGKMFNVIWYKRKFQEAATPESEALARWSMRDAENDLDKIIREYSFNDEIRQAIYSLV